jgi:4-amino-4-deoxy-L-arabinose transferase-like glycosyltransferase
MPILRLAYTTQFLVALIAIFVLWSEVGGQSHLDLLPWHVKLVLGAGAAFCAVKATAAAVANDQSWNGRTLRWFGLLVLLIIACGLASYYAHVYLEEDDSDQDQGNTAISFIVKAPAAAPWAA